MLVYTVRQPLQFAMKSRNSAHKPNDSSQVQIWKILTNQCHLAWKDHNKAPLLNHHFLTYTLVILSTKQPFHAFSCHAPCLISMQHSWTATFIYLLVFPLIISFIPHIFFRGEALRGQSSHRWTSKALNHAPTMARLWGVSPHTGWTSKALDSTSMHSSHSISFSIHHTLYGRCSMGHPSHLAGCDGIGVPSPHPRRGWREDAAPIGSGSCR
jgi:hypothetical protein